MSSEKYDYSQIDPILKKNPDISWAEFQKKYPDIKLSNWCFLSRRALIRGEPGYGRDNGNKSIKISKNIDIDAVIDELYPMGTLKDQYKIIAETLLQDPLTTHKSMINSGAIRMSNSNFYQFRRKFTKKIGLKTNGRHGATNNEPILTRVSTRKKNILYKTIFEKEVGKNLNPKALQLLQDFINTLNQDKIMNVEIFEIISPRHVIEVREYSK